MAFQEKVRARVKSYFNPETFDPLEFRKTLEMALVGLVIGEVAVYMMLRESARVGELPSYITDVVIISISTVEFVLDPFVGWLGSRRRRSMLLVWMGIALLCILPLFGAPGPDIQPDTAFCTSVSRFLPDSITARAAVRLSILILAAMAFALARAAVTAHGLAYLEEYSPSVNLHMNVAMLLLVRVLILHVGTTLLQGMMQTVPWLQFLMIVFKFVLAIVRLFKYPAVPPTVAERVGSERSLVRSLGRVLRNRLAVLQILAMALLAAAVWGFGSQEAEFSKMKYHIVPGEGMIWEMNAPIRGLFIILGVTLAGYLYTEPVMTSFKQQRAVGNAVRVTSYCVILFVVMTAALGCAKGPVAGLDDTSYVQPNCGRVCGCDRPWTQFAPVCAPAQMTTYYSPCHAGCAAMDTVGGLQVYVNCTCAGGARVSAGACADGACAAAAALHALLFSCAVLAATLAFAWQGTVFLENVDRRDTSTAVGLASGVVSLFAFVGSHGFFKWISATTCAKFRGHRCLMQNSQFAPWVGYSGAALAAASLVVSGASFVLLRRRKHAEKTKAEDIDLS